MVNGSVVDCPDGITMSASDGGCGDGGGDGTVECKIGGLTNGLSYSFAVRTHTAQGDSAASQRSRPVVAGSDKKVPLPGVPAVRSSWLTGRDSPASSHPLPKYRIAAAVTATKANSIPKAARAWTSSGIGGRSAGGSLAPLRATSSPSRPPSRPPSSQGGSMHDRRRPGGRAYLH